jgi:transcriptional regulator with XRE-family HTH domain
MVVVNLATMANVQEGTVYLSLDADVFDDEGTVARWVGHCEFEERSQNESGPEFLDASDAVNWWRTRGAKRIYIRLDFGEYLWAGEGPPPDAPSPLSVFDADDPRGRPGGAAQTFDERRRHFSDAVIATREAASLDEGRRLTRRREAVHLSAEDLADRVGQSTEWILDIESGKSTYDVSFSQWIDLVWTTRHGWPEETRVGESESTGWVAQRGQFLREAEIFVNNMLGHYD